MKFFKLIIFAFLYLISANVAAQNVIIPGEMADIKFADLNGDGFMRILATGVENPDDTDKDGIPDFYDVDDDGDNYTTKLEIKNPLTGLPYPFADIPTCSPSGKKVYLDKTCHP